MSVVYDAAFYSNQAQGSLKSARDVLPIVLSIVHPNSIVDVGCGLGTWLSVATELGVGDILGLDGEYVNKTELLISKEVFIPTDLTKTLQINRKFDLVISLEVAEHIPFENASKFVEGLVSLGDIVLFSAAIPGQGGVNHLNEQWPEYWSDLFLRHNYVAIDCIRHKIWNNNSVDVCYRQNTILYVEKGYLQKSPQLLKEQAISFGNPLSVVHPLMFEDHVKRNITLGELVKAFPQALADKISYISSRMF